MTEIEKVFFFSDRVLLILQETFPESFKYIS